MNWYNDSSDEYSNTPKGLDDMLRDFNLLKEFDKHYISSLDMDKNSFKSEEEYNDYCEVNIKYILEEVDNVGQVFCELHEHFPKKFKKNSAAMWNWKSEDRNKDGAILIDVYEVTYTKEESISHIVELIREHNISQADIFEEVMLTS
jgi:hypothetical protein